MTTFREEQVLCGVCGSTSHQPVMTSTSSFGDPDLDSRPGPPARDALFLSVQRCPRCGFCARRLHDGHPGLLSLVESAEYQAQLADERYPEVARALLCAALVLDEREREDEATWCAIEAAWACDDAGASAEAKACRERAVELLVWADDGLVDDWASEGAIMTDVLRRAGRFDDACLRALRTLAEHEREMDPVVRAVLNYELVLIEREDDAAHSLAEVEDEVEDG